MAVLQSRAVRGRWLGYMKRKNHFVPSKYAALFTILLAVLLLLPSAHASYSIYPELGANEKYSGTFLAPVTSNYTTYTITSATGTYTEPIAFDMDLDGITELFFQTSGSIGVFEADSPNNAIGSIGGELAISPVACDINNDGSLDFVAVVTNGSDYALVAADFDENHNVDIFASQTVTVTNATGNIVCSPFYSSQGDTRNYAIYVDQYKTLNLWTADGTGFTGTNLTESSFGADDSVVSYSLGSHRIAESSTINPTGADSVFFMIGHYAVSYFGDGTFAKRNITPSSAGIGGYSISNPSLGAVQVYGGVNDAGPAIVYHFDNDLGSGVPDPARSFYSVVKLAHGIFGNPAPSMTASAFSIPSNGWTGITSPNGFGPGVSTDSSDLLYSVLYQTNAGTPAMGTQNALLIQSSLSGSILSSVAILENQTGAFYNKTPGIFLADANNDRELDIIKVVQTFPNISTLGYYSGALDFATFTPIATLSNAVGSNLFMIVPQMVDLNDDGSPDFIINGYTSGETYVILSSGGTVASTNRVLPFDVAILRTVSNDSVAQITAEAQPGIVGSYSYAVACSISALRTIYNEAFRTGYNATTQNVTIDMLNGTYSYDYSGLNYIINLSKSSFGFFKRGNEEYFGPAQFSMAYDVDGDNAMNVILYSGANRLSDWYELNLTGTNLTVYHRNMGLPRVYLGSATVANQSIAFLVSYNPVTDLVLGALYENATISINGNIIATGVTTYEYEDNLFQNAQVYSSTNGTYVSFHNIGFVQTSNLFPAYLSFQNGVSQIIGGVEVVNTGDASPISGNGFTVTRGLNNVFTSTCHYPAAGTYTQRHYLNRQSDVLDYLNYEDVTVIVSAFSGNTTINAGTDDNFEFSVGFLSLAEGLGFRSVGSKLLFWFLIALLVAVGLFLVHWMLGMVGFVAMMLIGAPLGFVPVWMLLIFVIICAGIGAAAYRQMASGT